MKDNNYKITVIIPVYNTENYLSESIGSIIKQSIGFNNIELILINDGSTDNSENICLRYTKKYNNIKYIKQKNQGVSATRNNGAKMASSDYILFLDSDDLLNKKSLESLYSFIIKHPEIDFVGSRCKYFDRKNDWHYSDYRFKNGDIVIDINNPKYITYNQYFSTGVLYKKDAFLKVKYNVDLKYNEDIILIGNLLLNNNKFGLVCNSILYYRKRNIKNSAVDNQKLDLNWILKVPDLYLDLIKKIKKKYKKIPYYFQYFIYFIMRDRLNTDLSFLTSNQKEEAIDKFNKLLNIVSPEIIALNKTINTESQMYLLKLKNKDLNVKINKNYTMLNNLKVDVNDLRYFAVNALEIKNNKLEITLAINTLLINPKNININGYTGEVTDFTYRKNPKDLYGNDLKYDNIYKYNLPIIKKDYTIKTKDIVLPIYIQNIKKKYPIDLKTKIIYRKKYIIKYNNEKISIVKSNIFNRAFYSIKRKKYLKQLKKYC